MRIRTLTFLIAAIVALAACSSDSQGGSSAPPASGDETVVIPAMSEVTVGTQRFTFAAFTKDGDLFETPQAAVQFYLLKGQEDVRKRSYQATFYRLEIEVPHLHEGGEVHGHQDVKGFYLVPQAEFDSTGVWRADVTLGTGERKGSLAFQVEAGTETPAVGAPAPASKNLAAKDVPDLTQLTTRTPPYPRFHQVSIAEAIQEHRPLVVAFSTPAFCVSRICGPVLEIVRSVADGVGDETAFVQIEPYDITEARTQGKLELTPVSRQWALQSEPWVFVVDKQGKIAAKFEGLLTRQELLEAIRKVGG